MEPRDVIVRHSAPCALDQAEYGTICIAKDTSKNYCEVFLQTNKDSVIPKWEFIENFKFGTPQEIIDSVIDKRLKVL